MTSTSPEVTLPRRAFLPDPVRRYLDRAVGSQPPDFREVRLRQVGDLRTGRGASERFRPFVATETLSLDPPSFDWDARVRLSPRLPRALHMRVRDGFADGHGQAEVRLCSSLRLGREEGGAELDQGALLRYLAESPWLPMALLPENGALWTPIDDEHALVSLSAGGTEAFLEVEFGPEGLIRTVYSPARPFKTPFGYKPTPWRGRHWSYQAIDGLVVPTEGEVEWQIDGEWLTVWRGRTYGHQYR